MGQENQRGGSRFQRPFGNRIIRATDQQDIRNETNSPKLMPLFCLRWQGGQGDIDAP